VYLLLDFSILENGAVVNFWWLVGGKIPRPLARERAL